MNLCCVPPFNLKATATLLASAALLSGCGGSGSSNSGGDTASTPVTIQYSVAIEDLSYAVSQSSSTVSQAPTLNQYEIAVVSLNAEGIVQETFDLEGLSEIDGGASFTLATDPQVNLAVVVVFGELLELSVGDELPSNALVAPVSASAFDVGLTSTSAYRSFLSAAAEQLSDQGSIDLNDLPYSTEQLDNLINDLQAITEDLDIPDYTDESIAELVGYHSRQSAREADYVIGQTLNSLDTSLVELLQDNDLYQLGQYYQYSPSRSVYNLDYSTYGINDLIARFSWNVEYEESERCRLSLEGSTVIRNCVPTEVINPVFTESFAGGSDALIWSNNQWVESNQVYLVEVDSNQIILTDEVARDVQWQLSGVVSDISGLSVKAFFDDQPTLEYWFDHIGRQANFDDNSIKVDITKSPVQDIYRLYQSSFSVYTNASNLGSNVIDIDNLAELVVPVDQSFSNAGIENDVRLVEIAERRLQPSGYQYIYIELLDDNTTRYYAYSQIPQQDQSPLEQITSGVYQAENLPDGSQVYHLEHPSEIRELLPSEYRGTLFGSVAGDVLRGEFISSNDVISEVPLLNQQGLDSIIDSMTLIYSREWSCDSYLQQAHPAIIYNYGVYLYFIENCEFTRPITEEILGNIEQGFDPINGPFSHAEFSDGEFVETPYSSPSSSIQSDSSLPSTAPLYDTPDQPYLGGDVPSSGDRLALAPFSYEATYELTDRETMHVVANLSPTLATPVSVEPVDDVTSPPSVVNPLPIVVPDSDPEDLVNQQEWAFIGQYDVEGETVVEFLIFDRSATGTADFELTDDGDVTVRRFLKASQ